MEKTVFWWNSDVQSVRVAVDFVRVDRLLQEDTAWGCETMRMSGIPPWVWNAAAWDSRVFLTQTFLSHKKTLWAYYMNGSRVTLAYRMESKGTGVTEIHPTCTAAFRRGWPLLVGLGFILPGVTTLFAWAAGWRGLQVQRLSASLLPGFCRYLREKHSSSPSAGFISGKYTPHL